MKRYEDLDELSDYIWSYTERGVRLRENAMATPAFATHGPGLRTVALRRVDVDERALIFHTDIRSKKVDQIEANPRAVWLAYDRDVNQQFQFMGQTTIHTDGDLVDELWESESPDELVFYFKRLAPGAPITDPLSGMDIEVVDEEVARKNFAVIRTVVDEIIWQHLHPDGEYRARFLWVDEKFEGQWVVP